MGTKIKTYLTLSDVNRFCVLNSRHTPYTLDQVKDMLKICYVYDYYDENVKKIIKMIEIIFKVEDTFTLTDVKRLLDTLTRSLIYIDFGLVSVEINNISVYALKRYIASCGSGKFFVSGSTNRNVLISYINALFPYFNAGYFKGEVAIDTFIVPVLNRRVINYLLSFDGNFGYMNKVTKDDALIHIQKFIDNINRGDRKNVY